MKMMKTVLAMVLFSFIGCGIVSAQETQTESQKREINYEELMQRRIDRLQKSLVLDDKTAAKFAPLYKEYLTALRSCITPCPIKDRTNLTDADREKRIMHRFECRQKMLDTQKAFYPKFKKILNASQLEKIFSNGDRQEFRGNRNAGNCYDRKGSNSPFCNGTHQHKPFRGRCPR